MLKIDETFSREYKMKKVCSNIVFGCQKFGWTDGISFFGFQKYLVYFRFPPFFSVLGVDFR